MRYAVAALASALGLALAGGARAQGCLSINDGQGNVSVTCPDGRSGYLHADPNGVAAGLVGTTPFAAAGADLAPPTNPILTAPSIGYVAPPPPPLAAAEPPTLAPVSPRPALTPLDNAWLMQQAVQNAAEARRKANQAARRHGR